MEKLYLFPELVLALLLGLALIAILDLAWQKYDYIKQLRMSHQDIKDEYKETDGQPEVKQKIKTSNAGSIKSCKRKCFN